MFLAGLANTFCNNSMVCKGSILGTNECIGIGLHIGEKCMSEYWYGLFLTSRCYPTLRCWEYQKRRQYISIPWQSHCQDLVPVSEWEGWVVGARNSHSWKFSILGPEQRCIASFLPWMGRPQGPSTCSLLCAPLLKTNGEREAALQGTLGECRQLTIDGYLLLNLCNTSWQLCHLQIW